MRYRGVTLGLVAVAAFGVAAAVWAAWPVQPQPTDWSDEYRPAPPSAAAVYDLTPKPAPEIAPGTVIGTTAPPGWSHLVIKSLPRVRPDHRAGLPDLTVEKAGWMFTAFLAEVGRDKDGSYMLKRLGLGLGAKGTDRDVVVTSDTAGKHGVHVGLFGGMILDKGYDVQRKAVVPLWSPAFGLLDTPVWFKCGDTNRLVRYRYALLADRAGGALTVLMWSLGADGTGCSAMAEVVRVAPNTIDPAELVVDRRKVNRLGMPSDDAFAVEVLPPGVRRPMPESLRQLAGTTRFSPDSARDLEAGLRRLARDFSP
ncbi:MAG: hypothetical protein U0804_14355 [Gemmataceae bacterium]